MTAKALIPISSIPEKFISERAIYFSKKELKTTLKENIDFQDRVTKMHDTKYNAFMRMIADEHIHLHIDADKRMYANGRDLTAAISSAAFASLVSGLDAHELKVKRFFSPFK